MAQTRTFKVSGLGCLIAVGLLVLGGFGILKTLFTVLGTVGLVVFGCLFAASATAALFRGILWRVGSRLLVSHLLIGIVPLAVFLGSTYAVAWMLTSQLAARRVESAFAARRAELRRAAAEAVRAATFDEEALEGFSWVHVPRSGAPQESGPIPAAEVRSRAWLSERESFLTRRGGHSYACTAETAAGATLLACLPLDRSLKNALGAQLHAQVGLSRTRVSSAKSGSRRPGGKRNISFNDGEQQTNVTPVEDEQAADKDMFGDAPPPDEGGFLAARNVFGMLALPEPVVDWESGAAAPSEHLAVFVRTSFVREFRELFGESRIGGEGLAAGTLVLMFLRGLLIAGITVYVLVAILAGALVFRIARASRRLSIAFDELGKGNLAHRASLKGKDQLAALIHGFNRMAEHLQANVAERAEREALEHELSVARDLQRRLLPPSDFHFAGVEIAVDFRPAAAIGGDFYFLAGEGTDRLVVAIADVSGHGLPTGIVMASARASLAALSQTGMAAADLFTTLDQEILASTDARTFVTMAHARFRLSDGLVEVTNAGHLYPYRVLPDGTVSAVQNPSRPLGVTLPGRFVTVSAPVAVGDLWVFPSDGIVEAMAPGSEEEFGFARLERVLSQNAGNTAAGLRDAVLAAWRAFTSRDEPEDDRTLIVLRINGD